MSLRGQIKRGRKAVTDLGFGTKIVDSDGRFVLQDGGFNIKKIGNHTSSIYKSLVLMSWPKFLLYIVVVYTLTNALFAVCFLLNGVEHIGVNEGGNLLENFAHSFFFSVQTFTTVGYGAMNPTGIVANILSSLVSLVGLMSAALATGLFFARFSMPVSHVVFSENAIICPSKTNPRLLTFQFRIANQHHDPLLEVHAQVIMTWVDESSRRLFLNLDLERDYIEMLPLNWTIVHPIDKTSPLYGKDEDDLKQMKVEFLVHISGYDEVFADQVHKNTSYIAEELEWYVRFKSMYRSDKRYAAVLDLDKLNDTEPLDIDVQR